MRFSKYVSAAIILTVAIPSIIVIAAYGITTFGAGSLCLSETGWSNAADKISGAKRYIERHPLPGRHRQSAILAGFNLPSCCKIDKGDVEIPDLSLSAFILHGKTHYVHVPMSETVGKRSHQVASLLTVDGCGNGISHGIDL